MTTEKLIVKNFGPIREAELDLRKVTVLIGEQASGKSVLAKLVNIFSALSPVKNLDDNLINEKLSTYKLNNFKNAESVVSYDCDLFFSKFIDGKFTIERESQYLLNLLADVTEAYIAYEDNNIIQSKTRKKADYNLYRAERQIVHSNYLNKIVEFYKRVLSNHYFPAERILIPMLFESIFSLTNSEINIPKFILDFGEEFEFIRGSKSNFKIPILNIKYFFDGAYSIELQDGTRLNLNESSSGFQSIIPMLLMIDSYNSNNIGRSIIEEPELNLYPTTQKKLVEYLIEKCTKGDNRLIITTHSPYILTALNNCIQAHNVAKMHPESAEEVNKLVPPQYQIAYEDVSAYYVGGGTVKSIMNEEFQMIDANALDDVSEELSIVFDKLLNLKYQNQD